MVTEILLALSDIGGWISLQDLSEIEDDFHYVAVTFFVKRGFWGEGFFACYGPRKYLLWGHGRRNAEGLWQSLAPSERNADGRQEPVLLENLVPTAMDSYPHLFLETLVISINLRLDVLELLGKIAKDSFRLAIHVFRVTGEVDYVEA